jgi:LSD1 subclass zinc finger protein
MLRVFMKHKIRRTTLRILFGFLLILLIFAQSSYAQQFDKSYSDPQGDVLDSQTGQQKPSGYEHIDILLITSTSREIILETQLIFQMQVAGVITNSDEITYSFQILDDGELIYYITYQNGICTGVNMADSSMDVLQASGTGTNTLEVSVQLSDVGDVTIFDFGGMTLEYLESQNQFFLDSAGNIESIGGNGISFDEGLVVAIKNPKSGATVSNTRTISGFTSSDHEMMSVEIQMDSKSSENWNTASTSDNWGNWSYELDTKILSEGKHTIHARAYNGTDYFFDAVKIYVNQENVQSPKTATFPKLRVGEWFYYEIEVSVPSIDGSISYDSAGHMNFTIEDLEKIIVEGKSIETYVIKVEGTQVSSSQDFETTIHQEGYDWIRSSDLANVRSSIKSTSTTVDGDDTYTSIYNLSLIYDPPINKYDFPMSIGETWTESASIYYDYDDGEDTFSETYEGPFEFEALHVETVLVPSGSFETYVVWSEDYFYQGNGVNCNLDYYSPKLGFPVKTESYDSQRNLYYTMELADYEKQDEEDAEDNGIFGISESNMPYFLLIIIVIVIIIVIALIKRRSSSSYEESQSYVVVSEESKGEVQSGGSTRPQVKPLSQIGTLKQTDSLKDHRSPIRFVKCPKCSHLISYKKGVSAIQCPFCNTVHKV